MQLQRFVDALKADLSAVAELGNEETAEVAGRLVLTLQASVGLRLLDALSEVALELNEKLPGGHVEVRLTGQDPELVFVSEEPEAPAAASDEAYTARITLRLPESLKTRAEADVEAGLAGRLEGLGPHRGRLTGGRGGSCGRLSTRTST